MKLAIAYSTKDEVENTRQTWPRLVYSVPLLAGTHVFWADASETAEALEFYRSAEVTQLTERVTGGADAAIAWKLTKALADSSCTHIMLLENDVLLDEDWYEPTMELFEKGKR